MSDPHSNPKAPTHIPTSPRAKNIHTTHPPKKQTPAHPPTDTRTKTTTTERDALAGGDPRLALPRRRLVRAGGQGHGRNRDRTRYVYVYDCVYLSMWLGGMCSCEYTRVRTHPYPSMHIYTRPSMYPLVFVYTYNTNTLLRATQPTPIYTYTNTCHSATRARGAGRVGPGGDSGRVSPDVREHRAQAHPGAREAQVCNVFGCMCMYMDGSRVGGGVC